MIVGSSIIGFWYTVRRPWWSLFATHPFWSMELEFVAGESHPPTQLNHISYMLPSTWILMAGVYAPEIWSADYLFETRTPIFFSPSCALLLLLSTSPHLYVLCINSCADAKSWCRFYFHSTRVFAGNNCSDALCQFEWKKKKRHTAWVRRWKIRKNVHILYSENLPRSVIHGCTTYTDVFTFSLYFSYSFGTNRHSAREWGPAQREKNPCARS